MIENELLKAMRLPKIGLKQRLKNSVFSLGVLEGAMMAIKNPELLAIVKEVKADVKEVLVRIENSRRS